MKKSPPLLPGCVSAGCLAIALPASGQIPNTLLHSLLAPPGGAQNAAQLGSSVAVDGAYAVVGAPFDDLVGSDAGVVKVFDTTTGALLHLIPNPQPVSGDKFGNSVAISGTRVVVGSWLHDTTAVNGINGVDSGSVYIYDLAGAAPTVPVAVLENPEVLKGGFFGTAVAISGTRVVAGRPSDRTSNNQGGATYIYDVSGDTPALPVAILRDPNPSSLSDMAQGRLKANS